MCASFSSCFGNEHETLEIKQMTHRKTWSKSPINATGGIELAFQQLWRESNCKCKCTNI